MNNIEPSAVVNLTLMLVVMMAMLVNFLKTLGQEGLTMVDIWMFFCLFISTVFCNSAHALLRGLSDPALSMSGISGSEGEDYLMITET